MVIKLFVERFYVVVLPPSFFALTLQDG